MKNTLKKAISAISASLLLAQPMAAAEFYGTNPIVQDKYTADPAPMVVGDTLYVYTSHDEDELIDGFYTMFEWCCYSTTDMVNWTDHGVVFSLEEHGRRRLSRETASTIFTAPFTSRTAVWQ